MNVGGTKPPNGGENGSAVVDFVLSSFAILAIFASAMAIVTNLYLRIILTSSATDAARLLARADISSGCDSGETAKATAIEQASQSVHALIGDKLTTLVSAQTTKTQGFCTAIVTIAARLPGLPLLPKITNFDATAHATLELQQ